MAATRSAACATCACRCATLRALEGFADGADYDAFVAALAADASLLPAPPLAGAPCTGRVERRLRCADCGAAWRLAEPDPAGRGQWRREPPSGFDALAGDLAALERLLRREDGRTMLPGVRELRRVVESLAAERLSPLDPEAARASSEAGRMLAGMLSHKAGLADFHVWRDDVDDRRRENDALRALLDRLQRGFGGEAASGAMPVPVPARPR